LKAIHSDLREMRFAADVDRRNATSMYNNLAAEFGAAIGKLDAKAEIGFEIVNERVDPLEEKVDQISEKVDRLEKTVGAGFARIEQLFNRG
jgi:hypothetical protein